MNIITAFRRRRMAAVASRVRPRAVISGYFGYGNSGDDTSLSCLISSICNEYRAEEIAVLCRNPRDICGGVLGIWRYDLLRMISVLRRSRLLISGGGSLFQNSTSIRSLLYYVSVIAVAKLCGARVMICANGIGPIKGKLAGMIVRRAVMTADHVSVRDPVSRDRLVKMNIPPERIVLGADPAFRLAMMNVCGRGYARRAFGMRDGVRYFAVSLRESWCRGDDLRRICRACRDIYLRFGLTPVLITMQESEDGELCRLVAGKICGEALVIPYLSGEELCRLMSEMEFVLSMRLHLMIYAATAGTPSVGISVDPKIDAAADILTGCVTVDMDGLCGESLYRAVSLALSADREVLLGASRNQAHLSDMDISTVVGMIGNGI